MTHLKIEERYAIYEMNKAGYSSRAIGKKINRGKSTVCYELKRLKCKYRPDLATQDYTNKIRGKKRKELDKNPKLRKLVKELLQEKHSPDVISGRLRYENRMTVSTETIYHYIYESELAKKEKWYEYLATRRKQRLAHGIRKRKKKSCIPNRISISERPDIAKAKLEIGHFEGDLTFNKGNQSVNISALVDIKSQKVFLEKNASKRSEEVIGNMNKRFKKLAKIVKTVTYDNGKEFTLHEKLFPRSKRKIYFCNPYSPWQKPLVEKLNSMIHRMYPKSCDITKLTNSQLRKIENKLNNLPRRILEHKTPNEVWNESLLLA